MISSYDKQLLHKVFAQDAAIGSVFNLFTRAISGKLTKLKDGGWDKNPQIEKEIDYELAKLQKNLEGTVYNSQKWGFDLSKAKNDDLVKNYIKGMAINGKLKEKLFGVNEGALEAFLNRKVDGLDLSGRIWNIKGQVKDQMGYYLESGIATGRGANLIAQDVKQILQDPDALYRRVRNSKGNLVPSQQMKGYKTDPGMYKSAHQNAVRLAATETNMAYRMADHSRWQNLDFVVGYEVKLSHNHPATDICDDMKGRYPKDFVFRGWHPRCFCHAVPVMMDEDEYLEYMDADEETATAILERNEVKAIPDSASKFITKHKETIDGWKSTPYWVKDNFQDGKIGKGLMLAKQQAPIPQVIPIKVEPKSAPIPRFIPAQSIKEAESYAHKNKLANEVNFKGLTVETANDLNRAMEFYDANFPELRESLQYVGSTQERNKFYIDYMVEKDKTSNSMLWNSLLRTRGNAVDAEKRLRQMYRTNIGTIKPNVYAQSCSHSPIKGVTINTKFGGNNDMVTAALDRDVKSKWHPDGCNTVKSIFDHEYGHEIDKLLNLQQNDEVKQLFKEHYVTLGDELSRYAQHSVAEFIAEAWAEYINNVNPRALSIKVGKLIETVYRKKTGK